MKLLLHFAQPGTLATPLLVVFAGTAAVIDRAPSVSNLLAGSPTLSEAVQSVFQSGEFEAGENQVLLLHHALGIAADRVLVVGVGSTDGLSPAKLRTAAGTAVRQAKDRGLRSIVILAPPSTLDPAIVASAITEGALVADFDSDIYKSNRKDRSVTDVAICFESASAQDRIEAAVERSRILAESQNFARSLVLEPGNVLTPTELGKRAAAMAAEVGIECQVHSTPFLQEHGMNAFLAVAQGSVQPPALIQMRYEPARELAPDAPVVALVGKGITFDTGGISIKSAEGMDKMKYDMAGAAAMLGAMRALALLKPAVRIVCLVCSAENMPSGSAYRPGDVVTAMSGTTIEVMNTDAEGRMVLADGLHYARTLGATHLIDAATLTGACVVALGKRNAGLFSNNEDACSRFTMAAGHAGESFWRLPCTDDYHEDIKSQIADIQNTGVNRWGGAITAAMFLKVFAANTPWVHLDIAGQAWIDETLPHIAKGPSGVAVRSIFEWVRSFEAV